MPLGAYQAGGLAAVSGEWQAQYDGRWGRFLLFCSGFLCSAGNSGRVQRLIALDHGFVALCVGYEVWRELRWAMRGCVTSGMELTTTRS